ncbi:MAG: hypothetical protein M2R45_02077 [Verrucomicrobia subdivision 3 bacterium]|nr:hypothetical protein [Limisphaerales bacterium]MCS1413864.1 hypothetical protein [Limisphaerales bacterium]
MASKPRNWRRIGKWTFWITNIVGAIIAIPILAAAWPLLKVYWSTRSESAVESNAAFQTNQSLARPEVATEALIPKEELAGLETQLDQISYLDRAEINQIIAQHFGPAQGSTADPNTFDEESAVFEDVNKVFREINGVRYHIYMLDLKDQNGNRSTQLAAYEKPNADYERSMQIMKLVQENSQLKSIYDAFSHVLANMSNEQDPIEDDEENPEIELEMVDPKAEIQTP